VVTAGPARRKTFVFDGKGKERMDHQETSAEGTISLDDKSKKTLADYIGDMASLEGHIEEALDRQLKQVKDDEIALAAVRDFHDMVKHQRDAVRALKDEYGGTAGSPIKEAGSALLGKAAGIIDMVRTEGVSKSLRDDYTAFNLAAMGYTMLHTTAVALGDRRVADLAGAHLRGYARAVQRINQIIPDVVVADLTRDGHKIQTAAADQTRATADTIWKETAPSATDRTVQAMAG
jgi:ferritin-like metal-binding protein YciE